MAGKGDTQKRRLSIRNRKFGPRWGLTKKPLAGENPLITTDPSPTITQKDAVICQSYLQSSSDIPKSFRIYPNTGTTNGVTTQHIFIFSPSVRKETDYSALVALQNATLATEVSEIAKSFLSKKLQYREIGDNQRVSVIFIASDTAEYKQIKEEYPKLMLQDPILLYQDTPTPPVVTEPQLLPGPVIGVAELSDEILLHKRDKTPIGFFGSYKEQKFDDNSKMEFAVFHDGNIDQGVVDAILSNTQDDTLRPEATDLLSTLLLKEHTVDGKIVPHGRIGHVFVARSQEEYEKTRKGYPKLGLQDPVSLLSKPINKDVSDGATDHKDTGDDPSAPKQDGPKKSKKEKVQEIFKEHPRKVQSTVLTSVAVVALAAILGGLGAAGKL